MSGSSSTKKTNAQTRNKNMPKVSNTVPSASAAMDASTHASAAIDASTHASAAIDASTHASAAMDANVINGINDATKTIPADLPKLIDNAIVDAYREAGPDHELEIRFGSISQEAFDEIFNGLASIKPKLKNPRVEQSMNMISRNVYEKSQDTNTYVRKLTFNNGAKIGDEYMLKNQLRRQTVDDFIKYTINVSHEKPMPKFPTSTNSLIRFKLRYSIDYEYKGGIWRIDLTAVRSAQWELMDQTKTKEIIAKMFSNDSVAFANKFLKKLPRDLITAYEFEIEHVSGDIDFGVVDVLRQINVSSITEMALQNEIYHVATHLHSGPMLNSFHRPTHRLKKLANQVIALTKSNYYNEIYPPVGYLVTDKADGKRVIISLRGGVCRIIASDSMTVLCNTRNTNNKTRNTTDDNHAGVVIVDAEFIDGVYHVFDVIVCDKNVSKEPMSKRIEYIEEACDAIVCIKCVPKKYVTLEQNLELGFNKAFKRDVNYIIDGLIISEPNAGYNDTKNYKWKPLEFNTIDFLAKKCPEHLLGTKPYLPRPGMELYLLFVGIDNEMKNTLGLGVIMDVFTTRGATNASGATDANGATAPPAAYFPIQFSPSANPFAYLYYHASASTDASAHESLDMQIIELGQQAGAAQWVFHRIRDDRKMEKNYYGNDFRVAELTYINFIDEFHFDDLFVRADSYFTNITSDMYGATNKFKRNIMSSYMEKYLQGAKYVIDEGAGRGGDLMRYQNLNIEHALFIDIDAAAIAELIRRKFNMFRKRKRGGNDAMDATDVDIDAITGGASTSVMPEQLIGIDYDKVIVKSGRNLTAHTLVADLKTPYQYLVIETYQFGIIPGSCNGIVSNFAFHYMCDTLENIRNLLMFNAKMLIPGGVFVFTVMDGIKIFELLKKNPKWTSVQDGVIKYAITREYVGDKFATHGQLISVKLPFSSEMYKEPLCNIDAVVDVATDVGFKLVSNEPMTVGGVDKSLTPEDVFYIELHSTVVLERT